MPSSALFHRATSRHDESSCMFPKCSLQSIHPQLPQIRFAASTDRTTPMFHLLTELFFALDLYRDILCVGQDEFFDFERELLDGESFQ